MLANLARRLQATLGGPPPLEPLTELLDDASVARGLEEARAHFAAQVQALCGGLAEPGQPADPRIQSIGGFRVQRLLGRGGMGAVYLALNDAQQPVVIKVPFSEFTSPEYVEIFFREFQTLSTVRHENIVRVFRYGRDPEQGVYYYVAEFVNGVTLKELIEAPEAAPPPASGVAAPSAHADVEAAAAAAAADARAPQAHGAQPGEAAVSRRSSPAQAAAVSLALVRALRFLKQRDVSHRDVKPGNVMIDRAGNIKLIDFGAAKFRGQSSQLTNSGVMMGTFDYMPPEVARRDARQPVGPERDVYALGVLHYRLLKGQVPFGFGQGRDAAESFARFASAGGRPLKDLRGVDRRSKYLLHRMTERDPDRRLVDFDELEARLLQIVKAEVEGALG